jgi:protein SCO1/2
MPSTSRSRLLVWSVPALALVAASLAVAGVVSRRSAAPPAELPVLGQVPAADLIDQRGQRLTTHDLRGQVTIVNFIFTRCPTICPVTSMKMQRLAAATAEAPTTVGLLSISVDPEHDRPEVLAAFAARYQADPMRWRFVTGDPEALRAAVEDGFKVAVERNGELAGGVPDIVHGGHFVLVDQSLAIRGYYDSSEEGRLEALAADAIRLAARPPALALRP